MSHVSNFIANLPEKRYALCIFNRATYSRCKALIERLSKYKNVKLTVIMSASLLSEEYGNASDYIVRSHDGVSFVSLDVPAGDGTGLGASLSAAGILDSVSRYLSREHFDAVIVVADRFETLPAAMAASYQNIPVIHIQGGEITGNIDDKVRHAVSKIADFHFVATDLSKQYLIEMGEERNRIWNTGCPSLDVIRSNVIKRHITRERYILSIFHPETENQEHAYEQTRIVMEAVLEYCSQFGSRCYWFYPNPDPGRLEVIRYLDQAIKDNAAFVVKAVNKEPEAFLRQLAAARLIIGNSSCGLRESSFLGVPSINVGERQRLRERAWNVIDAGYDKEEILKALRKQHEMERYPRSRLYGTGHAAAYIAEYLAHLEVSLKGPLTYPFKMEHKGRHFGEERFHDHRNRRWNPANNSQKLEDPSGEREALSG